MAIPAFEIDGFLPKGQHNATGPDFIAHFCNGTERRSLTKAITDILDFGRHYGATAVLFGGSFVTSTTNPTDIDCVIIFSENNQIPDFIDTKELDATKLDIFYASLEQPKLLGAIAKLFSQNKKGRAVGTVLVPIHGIQGFEDWSEVQPIDDLSYELIRNAYVNRHVIDRTPKKTLITIHGIRTHAEWNAEVAHIASSRGWIVAPFVYGYVDVGTLAIPLKREKIVSQFRAYVNDIKERYNAPISVIAHSFGTYVAASYLLGFDHPPVTFDTLITTGAILNPDLDLTRFHGRTSFIINEVAPNDAIVDLARAASLWNDPLIGNAGSVGFNSTDKILQQQSSSIFDHNNVIRRDVIAQRWMPWLEANVGQAARDARDAFIAKNPGTEGLFFDIDDASGDTENS